MIDEVIAQAKDKYSTEDLIIYGRKSTIEKLFGEGKDDLKFDQSINERKGRIESFEGYPIIIDKYALLKENEIMILPKNPFAFDDLIDYFLPLEET